MAMEMGSQQGGAMPKGMEPWIATSSMSAEKATW
jgi:hypothetical protein